MFELKVALLASIKKAMQMLKDVRILAILSSENCESRHES
jgi:hypothetical protein